MGQIRKNCSIVIPFFLVGDIKELFYRIEDDKNISCFERTEEYSTIFYKIKFTIAGEENTVKNFIEEMKTFEFGYKKK